jgi:hypothetical protein
MTDEKLSNIRLALKNFALANTTAYSTAHKDRKIFMTVTPVCQNEKRQIFAVEVENGLVTIFENFFLRHRRCGKIS